MRFGVVAVPERREQAWALTKRLRATLFMDHRHEGAYKNHMRALAYAATMNEHVVILEDDAQPVEGFEDKARAWINRYPEDVISFYLGTGHPAQWMREVDLQWGSTEDSVQLPQLIHAVCVTYPPGAARKILDGIKPGRRVDEAIGNAWDRATRRPIIYPKLSLVDHADDGQIDNPRLARKPRKARALA